MNRGNNFFIFFLISCFVHLIVGYILVQSSFHAKIEEPKIVSLELIQIDNVTNQTGTKHKSNAFNQSKPNLFTKNLPGHSPIKGFRSHNAKQLLNNFQAQNIPDKNNSTRVSNNSKSSDIKTQTLVGQQSQVQQSSQTQALPKKISPFAAKAQEFEQKYKQNTNNSVRKQSFSTRKSVNTINNASKNNINHNKPFHNSEVKKVSSIAMRAKEFEQKSKNGSQDNSTNIYNNTGNQVSNSKLSSLDKNNNTHKLQNNHTDNTKLPQKVDNLLTKTPTKLSKDANNQPIKEELQHKPAPPVQSKIVAAKTLQDSQPANIIPHDVKTNIATREQEISSTAQPSIKKFDNTNPQLLHDTNIETTSTTTGSSKTKSTFEHNTIDAEKTLSKLPVAPYTDGDIKRRDDHEIIPQAEQKVYLQPEKQIRTEQPVAKLDKLNTEISEAEQTPATNTLIEKNNDASTASSPQNVAADTAINHNANNNAVTELDTNKLLLKSETINPEKINQHDTKLVKNAADTTSNDQFMAIDAMLKISNNSKQQLLTQSADNTNPDVQDVIHNRSQSLETEPHDHIQPESNNKQLYNKQMEILSPTNSESNTDTIATEIKNHNKHSAPEENIKVNKDSSLVVSNSNIKTAQSKKPQEQQTTKTLNTQQTNNTSQAVAQNKDVKSPNSHSIPNNLNQKPLSPTPSSGNSRLPYSDSGPFHKLDVKSENSISYADTIRTQIQTHWNHTIGAVPGISVILRLTLQPDGNIKNIEEISAHCPGNNTAVCKAFIQNTKRSIWAAAPLQNLPIDKYELWQQLTFEFAPESQ